MISQRILTRLWSCVTVMRVFVPGRGGFAAARSKLTAGGARWLCQCGNRSEEWKTAVNASRKNTVTVRSSGHRCRHHLLKEPEVELVSRRLHRRRSLVSSMQASLSSRNQPCDIEETRECSCCIAAALKPGCVCSKCLEF